MGEVTQRVEFDVLGVHFGIESDCLEVIEPFACLLECFRRPDGVGEGQVLRLLVGGDSRESTIECNGDRYVISGGKEDLLAHTYSLLLHWIFGQVTGFFLLHGAVVARNGRGFILSGHSGTGKTTLGCALGMLDGWDWLSDDVAPLALADGMLHPFPKALSLRPGIASPEHLSEGTDLPVLEGRVKKILSPEALGLTIGAGPVPLEALVFLDPDPVDLHPDTPALSVVIHRQVPGLLERVRALPDVRSARERRGERFVQLEIETGLPPRCLSQVGELCREAGALVIGSARESQRAEPDFAAEPRLEPLHLDEAVRLFLRQLWGTAQFRLIAQLGGGAALYARVARILAAVRCHRLCPGRYEETFAVLRDLASGE